MPKMWTNRTEGDSLPMSVCSYIVSCVELCNTTSHLLVIREDDKICRMKQSPCVYSIEWFHQHRINISFISNQFCEGGQSDPCGAACKLCTPCGSTQLQVVETVGNSLLRAKLAVHVLHLSLPFLISCNMISQ